MPDGEQRFRVSRFIALIVGLLFVPPSVAWPLDLLRGVSWRDGADVMLIVTGVGWTGLAVVVRFMARPRLVLRGGELLEQRLFTTRRIPLSGVASIDRLKSRSDGVRRGAQDTLFLFRPHPDQPWVLDLVLVAEPEKFMAALTQQCRVRYGSYSPQNAPPWLRG